MYRFYIFLGFVFMLYVNCNDSKKEFNEQDLIELTEIFKGVDLLSRGYNKFSLRLYEYEDTSSVTLSFLYYPVKKKVEFLEYYPTKERFINGYRKSNLWVVSDNAGYSENSLMNMIIELFKDLSSIDATSTSQEFKELGIDRVFYLEGDNDRIYFINNLEEVSNEEWLSEISQSSRIGSKFYYVK